MIYQCPPHHLLYPDKVCFTHQFSRLKSLFLCVVFTDQVEMWRRTLLLLFFSVASTFGFQRVCYLTIDHKPYPNGRVNFDADLCTHINVMPITVDANGTVRSSLPGDVQLYQEVIQLKKVNPQLKVLAVLVAPNSVFHEISSSDFIRGKFVKSVIEFLNRHQFDGLDIDWEFPVYSSMRLSEKAAFARLLSDLRSEFDEDPKGGKLLSIATPADMTIIIPGYDVPSINRSVDYINLMAYDFFDYHSYYPFTGHNGALFPRRDQLSYFGTLNTAYAAKLWHALGIQKRKIMIGIPTYSHTYHLLFSWLTYPGAPATSYGTEYSYGEVCQMLKDPGSTRVFDRQAKVPYMYNGKVWISYEDEESIRSKAEWIRDQKFGGSMSYNLNNDDIHGDCSSETSNDESVDEHKSLILHKILKDVLTQPD